MVMQLMRRLAELLAGVLGEVGLRLQKLVDLLGCQLPSALLEKDLRLLQRQPVKKHHFFIELTLDLHPLPGGEQYLERGHLSEEVLYDPAQTGAVVRDQVLSVVDHEQDFLLD